MPMKPAAVLKKFFGLKEDQTTQEFVKEVGAFRTADPEGYREVVTDAAHELGTEPDFGDGVGTAKPS